MKSASDAPGSVGWRAEYSEGDVRRGAASGVYMGSKAIVQGYASAQEDYAYGNVNVTGAVVAAGGGVFVGRPIYDGFAIVDAGAPDIDVYANNRLVGRTNRGGKILVPSLPAYQKKPIRIDSQDLPINAIIPTTEKQVVVARESGASIISGSTRRRTRHSSHSGWQTARSFRPVPPRGSKAARMTQPEIVVGYDGQVYFDDLKSDNTAVLELETGTCTATFASNPSPEAQQTIDAVCQMKLFGPIVCLSCALALAAGSNAVQAQSCSFSMTDINFGLMYPPATSASPYATATGTFAAACTGDAGQTVYVCAKLGEGSGGMSNDKFFFDGSFTKHRFYGLQSGHGHQYRCMGRQRKWLLRSLFARDPK